MTVYINGSKYEIEAVIKLFFPLLRFDFREDGTCTLDGQEAYYFVPNMYAVNTGEEPSPTAATYEIVSLKQNALTLRHIKSKTTYRLKRVEE